MVQLEELFPPHGAFRKEGQPQLRRRPLPVFRPECLHMQAHTVDTLFIGKPLEAERIVLFTECNALVDPAAAEGAYIPSAIVGPRRVLSKIDHRIRRGAVGDLDVGQHVVLEKPRFNLVLVLSHVTVMPDSVMIEFQWFLPGDQINNAPVLAQRWLLRDVDNFVQNTFGRRDKTLDVQRRHHKGMADVVEAV